MIRPAWASNPDLLITVARQQVPRTCQQQPKLTWIYTVSQKGATIIFAITLANVDRF